MRGEKPRPLPTSGVAEGVLPTHLSADEPSVDDSIVWLDAVERGPMLRQVRGLGTLGAAEGSENLVAKVTLPALLAADVRPIKTLPLTRARAWCRA